MNRFIGTPYGVRKKREWFSLDFSPGQHAALLCHKAVHTNLNPHVFFAAWLTLSNNKCFGKENMLLKFHVSSLSVSVRMGSQLGNQKSPLMLWYELLACSWLLAVRSAVNRVASVLLLCVCVRGDLRWRCVYKDTPVWSMEYSMRW